MTRQEQIEEMATFISNYADKHDWELHEPEFEDLAIELYNAGYRKIDDLKAENKQLKTECALLDDELRIARQETIDVLNELKTKLFTIFGKTICSDLDTEDITDIIDELLEEYE